MRINSTLLFFLLLVPLSGFIAWAGDRIGQRVGKRRQTLFGLRPRHTATLITIASGVGIAIASFGVMLASSASFRDVIARGTALRQENARLIRDRENLSKTIKEAGERVRNLQLEAERAHREQQAAEVGRTEAVHRRSAAEAKVKAAQSALAVAEKALLSEKATLLSTRGSLRLAETRFQQAQKGLDEAQRRRKTAEAEVLSAEARLRTARGEATKAGNEVAKAQRVFYLVTQEQKKRLESQAKDLEQLTAQVGGQTTRLHELENLLEERKQELERQRNEVTRLNRDVATLEERRGEAQRAYDTLIRSTQALRSGRITYRTGEEVARLAIPPGNNVWKIYELLESLMTTAAKRAEARGARTGNEGIRAAWIPTRQLQNEETKRLETIRELDALRTLSGNIRRANEEVVVVVTALGNAVVGEPVPVDLKTWRNPLILTAGAPLGEIVLDGARPGQEIADALYRFLRSDIRQKLLEVGTIPIDEAGGETVGETSLASLLKALDAVRATKTRARVTVRAAADLRAADPVALEFEVKAVGPPPLNGQGDQ